MSTLMKPRSVTATPALSATSFLPLGLRPTACSTKVVNLGGGGRNARAASSLALLHRCKRKLNTVRQGTFEDGHCLEQTQVKTLGIHLLSVKVICGQQGREVRPQAALPAAATTPPAAPPAVRRCRFCSAGPVAAASRASTSRRGASSLATCAIVLPNMSRRQV